VVSWNAQDRRGSVVGVDNKDGKFTIRPVDPLPVLTTAAQALFPNGDEGRTNGANLRCAGRRKLLPAAHSVDGLDIVREFLPEREQKMAFTMKWWIELVISSLFAYIVFGNISSKAGYPRWHGFVMLIPILNIVAIVIFAFSSWPIETKVLDLELRGANR